LRFGASRSEDLCRIPSARHLHDASLETGKIEASLKDGVLTVRIPKRAELRPRKIEVRAS
jgi:hypothetical protein